MSSLKVSLFFSRIPLTSYKTCAKQGPLLTQLSQARLKTWRRVFLAHLSSIMFDTKLMISKSGFDIIRVCLQQTGELGRKKKHRSEF